MIYLRQTLLLLLFVSFVSSCGNDDNPANGGNVSGDGSFTINGAGFNNRTFTAPAPPQGVPFNPFAYGVYSPTDSITVGFLVGTTNGDTTTPTVIFGYLGNQTGNFQNASVPRIITVGIDEHVFIGGFEDETIGSAIIEGTTFNLNVTQFGPVGGRIQGSFNGTLRETDTKGGLGTTTITITGNFNLQRIDDDFGGDRTMNPFSYKEALVD